MVEPLDLDGSRFHLEIMCMHFILYVPLRYNIPSCIYATISIIENLQYNFPKMRGVGVEGRFEFFQKFIRFGSRTLPLRG